MVLQRIARCQQPPDPVELQSLIANWLMARCAACGGLNEPPSKPMRMPLVWNGSAWALGYGTVESLLQWSTACVLQ